MAILAIQPGPMHVSGPTKGHPTVQFVLSGAAQPWLLVVPRNRGELYRLPMKNQWFVYMEPGLPAD